MQKILKIGSIKQHEVNFVSKFLKIVHQIPSNPQNYDLPSYKIQLHITAFATCNKLRAQKSQNEDILFKKSLNLVPSCKRNEHEGNLKF